MTTICKHCRSCEVRWVQNQYGRAVMVNTKPDPFGDHVLRQEQSYKIVAIPAAQAQTRDTEPRYKLHVRTCQARRDLDG